MKSTTPQLRLTDRDLDVLGLLGDYRFLTKEQLAVLAFPSADSAARRLRDFVVHGLAHRVFVPVRPYDPSAESVFALTAKGAVQAATRRDGKRPPHLSPEERRSGLFLDHTLKRNDVRITLAELSRAVTGFRLLRWLQTRDDVRVTTLVEHRGRHERVAIVPDGVADVLVDGVRQVLAIEVDMGTVTLRRMYEKYRAYEAYWRSGGPSARFGVAAYRVLTLTNNARRLEALRRVARDSPGPGRGTRLQWFGLLADAVPHDPKRLLGSVFTTASREASPPDRLFPTLQSLNSTLCKNEPSDASSAESVLLSVGPPADASASQSPGAA